MMPPLLQGVGILSLPWLAGLVSASLRTIPRFEGLADRLADVARELSPERNPWILLVSAVGLTVGLRFLQSWRWAAESESDELRSGLDAGLAGGCLAVRSPGCRLLETRPLDRPVPPGHVLRGDQLDARAALHSMDGRKDHRTGHRDPGRWARRRPPPGGGPGLDGSGGQHRRPHRSETHLGMASRRGNRSFLRDLRRQRLLRSCRHRRPLASSRPSRPGRSPPSRRPAWRPRRRTR